MTNDTNQPETITWRGEEWVLTDIWPSDDKEEATIVIRRKPKPLREEIVVETRDGRRCRFDMSAKDIAIQFAENNEGTIIHMREVRE